MSEIDSAAEAIKQAFLVFQRRVKEKTSDPNEFIKIDELEALLGEMHSTVIEWANNVARGVISKIDEGGLVQKKKEKFKEKGIVLKTNRRSSIEIQTKHGKISISRYILIPEGKESRKKLKELTGSSSVAPLDDALGITDLPFKMTPDFMLECSFWAQNQSSYRAAEIAIQKIYNTKISDDTLRLVTNRVGSIIHDNDKKEADEVFAKLEACNLPPAKPKPGTLYLELDGAALNTRHINNEGSSWRENKLGVAFTSDDIKYHKNPRTGELEHRIGRREYISCLGSVTEFRKLLLALAVRNGYGGYEKTVFLSDGAIWIAHMIDEIFPDAIHILDFFHLSENVYTYGKAFFHNNPEKYKPWAERICQLLKEGKSDIVLENLKSMPRPQDCVDLPGYIKFHSNHIDYPTYQKMGFFIGSGAIESGNKVVLQKRLKQAGMRWEPETAQYMLALRAKVESNLWSECERLVRAYYSVA